MHAAVNNPTASLLIRVEFCIKFISQQPGLILNKMKEIQMIQETFPVLFEEFCPFQIKILKT